MKESTRTALKCLLNISVVVLGCGISCILIVSGLLCDSIPFINEHRLLLVSLAIGLMFIVMIASLIFYVMDMKTLYSVTVMAGVMIFGNPWLCSLYSFIGIMVGSVLAFAIGRLLGYRVVCWIVGKEELDKWLEKIKGKDYLILSIMFLLPLFPDDVLCFVAGLSSMTWPYFLIMITVTRALTITLSSLSFDSIPFTTWWGLLCWALIAAAVVLLFWLVIKYSDKIDGFIKNKLGLKLGPRRKGVKITGRKKR